MRGATWHRLFNVAAMCSVALGALTLFLAAAISELFVYLDRSSLASSASLHADSHVEQDIVAGVLTRPVLLYQGNVPAAQAS